MKNLPITKIVIFSHGMGLRRDNRGLFTYLSEIINSKGYKTILFDYNEIDELNNRIYVRPFSQQAVLLQNQIDKINKEYENPIVTIIGQSQGSFIPTMCELKNVSKVIAISPFFYTKLEDIVSRYKKEGNKFDIEGITRRIRSDGSTTIIKKEYWLERMNSNIELSYSRLAIKNKLFFICGLQDETTNIINVNNIEYAKVFKMQGDHDFKKPKDMENLASLIMNLLNS